MTDGAAVWGTAGDCAGGRAGKLAGIVQGSAGATTELTRYGRVRAGTGPGVDCAPGRRTESGTDGRRVGRRAGDGSGGGQETGREAGRRRVGRRAGDGSGGGQETEDGLIQPGDAGAMFAALIGRVYIYRPPAVNCHLSVRYCTSSGVPPASGTAEGPQSDLV